MKISQVLDPMTKDVFTQEEALYLIQKAFSVAAQKGIVAAVTNPTAPTTSCVTPSASESCAEGNSEDCQVRLQ
jgi:hypothetical protein